MMMSSHMILMLMAVAAALVCSVTATGGEPPADVPTQDELNQQKDSSLWDGINFLDSLESPYDTMIQSASDFVGQIDAGDLTSAANQLKALRTQARNNGFDDAKETLKELIRLLNRIKRVITQQRKDTVKEGEDLTDEKAENQVDRGELYNALSVAVDCGNSGTDGVYSNGDFCFKFSDVTMNVNDARVECQAYGMDLASVDSQAKHDYILSVLQNHIPQNQNGQYDFWIGGFRNTDNTFSWYSTNQPFSATEFNAWHQGEPNNSGGIENCVHIWINGDTWNDSICSIARKFICEV